METREIKLSQNADITTPDELAAYLLNRLEELIPEYDTMDDGDYDKHYISGLIAGFETVLLSIGYPVHELPEHEELL